MRDFIDQQTIEAQGHAVSAEALRRVYIKVHKPVAPGEFRQRLIEAGYKLADVAGGGTLVLHRRKRGG